VQRLAIGAGIATVVALTLSACAVQGESQSPTTPPATSASTSTPLDLGQFTPAPSGAIDEDSGETIAPKAVATWGNSSRAAAVAAAETVMTAFARPTLDQTTWWAQLSPLLTQQAQLDYSYVDPANVPASAVTGHGALVDETSAYVARVQVPTDIGTYTLVLTRAGADSPWQASKLSPPEGVH